LLLLNQKIIDFGFRNPDNLASASLIEMNKFKVTF
jgi:hypothetical protein